MYGINEKTAILHFQRNKQIIIECGDMLNIPYKNAIDAYEIALMEHHRIKYFDYRYVFNN